MRQYFVLLLFCYVRTAQAQTPNPLPLLYNTYKYTAYTVYDTTSGEPRTQVCGIGGSLKLHPTGTYKQRLNLVGPQGPVYFKQDGTFAIFGDSIRFIFSNRKGSDVQRGTYRFDAATRRLSIVIRGRPNGNRGVYELEEAEPAMLPHLFGKPRR